MGLDVFKEFGGDAQSDTDRADLSGPYPEALLAVVAGCETAWKTDQISGVNSVQ